MPSQQTHKRFNGRISIVTGELSGEIHGERLVKALRERLAVDFSGMGGPLLREAGVRVVYDYQKISVTGMGELVSKLPAIFSAYRTIQGHLREWQPALLILVDYPGFNLRLASFAARTGIPVVYFIPPQLWAWHEGRIKKVRRYVRKVLSILPFEEQYFLERGVDASYVGHPFVATVKAGLTREAFFDLVQAPAGEPLLTIMPGSRDHEVTRHTPTMIKVVDVLRKRLGGLSVVLALADTVREETVSPLLGPGSPVRIVKGHTHDALAYSDLALVASGSATLEAALLGTPSIVIYRLSTFSYILGRMLVKVPYVSLPNIIAGREVFPEFIQHLNVADIAERATHMLKNGREDFGKDVESIRTRLGSYDSYALAGNQIVDFLRKEYGTLPETARFS